MNFSLSTREFQFTTTREFQFTFQFTTARFQFTALTISVYRNSSNWGFTQLVNFSLPLAISGLPEPAISVYHNSSNEFQFTTVTFQFNDGTLVKSTRMSPVENWITDLIYGVNWNVGLVNWNVIRTKNGKPKFVKSIENR